MKRKGLYRVVVIAVLCGQSLVVCWSSVARRAHAKLGTPVVAFVVTNTEDSGPGSLRQAILDANRTPGTDTITITAIGTAQITSTLNITDAVTIIGPGADQFAVDGGGSVLLFDLANALVSLSGITLQHGFASFGAAAIYSNNHLTMTQVNILNNVGGSGAVRARGTATLHGGRFENNISTTDGGSALSGGSLNMTDTVFISNTALGGNNAIGFGGAVNVIYVAANGGLFERNRCTASRCTGGGLSAFQGSLSGTQFIGNTSIGDGGGAYFYGAAQISNARFEGNQCIPNLMVTNACRGGGLYADSVIDYRVKQKSDCQSQKKA